MYFLIRKEKKVHVEKLQNKHNVQVCHLKHLFRDRIQVCFPRMNAALPQCAAVSRLHRTFRCIYPTGELNTFSEGK